MARKFKFLNVVLVLTILLALTGCSTSTGSKINFIGESKHWIVSYSITQTQSQTSTARISYKGSDVESVGSVKYSFEASPYVKQNGIMKLSKKGYFESTSNSSKGPYPNKDLVIMVKIEWSGQAESIDLRHTNQQL